jgi:hypothetical protein
MDKQPVWTGKLMDANGRVGKLKMEMAKESGRGMFEVELHERDGRPMVLKSEVTLATEGANVRLRAPVQSAQEGKKLEWEANLTSAEAGRYARTAMLGTYGVAGGGTGSPLTKGVIILWQFS